MFINVSFQISFVEQGSDSDLFWEKLSDGILRAWAFEKKEVKGNYVTNYVNWPIRYILTIQ